MGYIATLGLTREKENERDAESRIARLLESRDGPEWENPELDLGQHLNYLEAYSEDRLNYESELRGRNQDNHTIKWHAQSRIDRMLTILFAPGTPMQAVVARQNLLRRYVSASSNHEPSLLYATQDLMDRHYFLHSQLDNRDSDRVEFSKVSSSFVEAVKSFSRFRQQYSRDPQLKDFAYRIDELFKENPVIDLARVLEKGGVLVMSGNQAATTVDETARRSGSLEKAAQLRKEERYWREPEVRDQQRPDGSPFWLSQSGPTGKGIFNLGSFEMGKHGQLKQYPGQEKDITRMQKFAHESAVTVYTLASMHYQAEVYNRLRTLGLPVCIPVPSDEGRFHVKNGFPITTRLTEDPVRMNLRYDADHRRFVIGGAHSGGKSELLRNIGGYVTVGLGGGIWPAEEGEVTLTRKIHTSLRKRNETTTGKGSLEREIKEAMEIDRKTQPRDLVLIDEFLDTSKPELARYVSLPLLFGEKGLCRGFVNSPGTIFIVDHRAPLLEESRGFEFMYPVLKRVTASSIFNRIKDRHERYGDCESEYAFYESLGTNEILIPTHTFAVGKPNPAEVQEHALHMWEKIVFMNQKKGRELRGTYRSYDLPSGGIGSLQEGSTEIDSIVWHVVSTKEGVWVNNPKASALPDASSIETKNKKYLSPSDSSQRRRESWQHNVRNYNPPSVSQEPEKRAPPQDASPENTSSAPQGEFGFPEEDDVPF